MPYIISVVNQKGGVGKTTVVVNLSAALARLGYPVLVVDLDPQANASTTMGLMDPYEVKSTTATVMLDRTESVAPWYDTIEDHVQLVYGHVQLTKVERELPRISTTMPGLVLKKRLSRMALAEDHLVEMQSIDHLGYHDLVPDLATLVSKRPDLHAGGRDAAEQARQAINTMAPGWRSMPASWVCSAAGP
jgi:hypothetical protein